MLKMFGLSFLVLLGTGTSLVAAGITCGTFGPTQTVPAGSYGVAFGGSETGACEALYGTMLSGECAIVNGCEKGYTWKGGAPFCQVDRLPNFSPPAYTASAFLPADKRGAVSCATCDN